MEKNKLPTRPDTNINIHRNFNNLPNAISDVSFERVIDGWRIICHLGKIQPQETVTTRNKIYIGALTSKNISISSEIYSDDLPKPKVELFQVNVEAKEFSYSIDQLTKI